MSEAGPLRGRLYGMVCESVVPPERFVAAAQALADGGCGIVQLRLKTLDDRRRLSLAREAAQVLGGRGVTLCINDRADIAALVADMGIIDVALHLGQDDLPAAAARAIVGTNVAVGLSTHDLAQAREAAATEAVDYIGFGPIFPTTTKANPDPVVGLETLGRVASDAGVEGSGVVAIGGITRARAAEVLAAGADAVAIIGDLYAGLNPARGVDLERLAARARELNA